MIGTYSSTILSIAEYLLKSILEISETKKDYSACHTDNKLSFYLKKEVKKYVLSMNFCILNSFFSL